MYISYQIILQNFLIWLWKDKFRFVCNKRLNTFWTPQPWWSLQSPFLSVFEIKKNGSIPVCGIRMGCLKPWVYQGLGRFFYVQKFGYIIFLIIDICSHTIIVFSCSMWIIMLRLLNIWMAKVVLNILFTLPLIFCQWCTCESKFMCNDVRLNYACQRLENTSDSITNICLDSGFESQRTFNRVFKERYKISPSDYRSTCVKEMLS